MVPHASPRNYAKRRSRRLSSSLFSGPAGPGESGLDVRQPLLHLGDLAIDLGEFDQQFLTSSFQVGLHG
jgi:hypothetical protein